jgi:hypothetical protein
MKWFKKITNIFLIMVLTLGIAVPASAATSYWVDFGASGKPMSSQYLWIKGSGNLTGVYVYSTTQQSLYSISTNQTLSTSVPAGFGPISGYVRYVRLDFSSGSPSDLGIGDSNGANVTYYSPTFSNTSPLDTTPPANVSNLTATADSSAQITLDFKLPTTSDFDKYKVYNNGALVYTSPAAQTKGAAVKYVATGLSIATSYTFKITTLDIYANESSGASVTKSTLSLPDVTNLNSSNVTDTKADISFTPVNDPNVTGYKIYLNGSLVTTLSNSLSSYTFTNLTANTNYTAKVTTIGGNLESTGVTTSFTTVDLTPPGDVSSVVGVGASETSIKLDWVPPVDNDLKQVNIWRNGVFVASVPAGTNTFTDTGLSTQPGGMPYQYTLITEDTSSNKSAGISTTVRTADTTPPDEVTNATATVLSDTAVKLDWQNPTGPNNTDFTSVEIYVGSNLIYSSQTSETTWTHVGLNPNTVYTWVLRTKDTTGNLSPGVSVTAKTFGPTDTPTNLSGTPGDKQVDLTWTAPSGNVQSYNIYQNGVKITSITGTSYTVTGLTNGTIYQFAVSAVNSYGESPLTPSISAKPYAAGKITGLKTTSQTPSYIKFDWNIEPNAQRYQIDVTITPKGGGTPITYSIQTVSNDVTVSGVNPGDSVSVAVSGFNVMAGLYGTATLTITVPSVNVPQLSLAPSITANDVFESGVSLASNFWFYLVLGLSFVAVPWIYTLIKRPVTAATPTTGESESLRGTHRGLNREIRHSLRGGKNDQQ